MNMDHKKEEGGGFCRNQWVITAFRCGFQQTVTDASVSI